MVSWGLRNSEVKHLPMEKSPHKHLMHSEGTLKVLHSRSKDQLEIDQASKMKETHQSSK